MTPTEILYAAAAAEVGILVRANNIVLAQQQLYRTRLKLKDPQLNRLSICVSRLEPDCLLIIRREPNPEDAPEPRSYLNGT